MAVATVHLNFELMVRVPFTGITSPLRFVGKMGLNIPDRKRSLAQAWTAVSSLSEVSYLHLGMWTNSGGGSGGMGGGGGVGGCSCLLPL